MIIIDKIISLFSNKIKSDEEQWDIFLFLIKKDDINYKRIKEVILYNPNNIRTNLYYILGNRNIALNNIIDAITTKRYNISNSVDKSMKYHTSFLKDSISSGIKEGIINGFINVVAVQLKGKI